MATGAGPSTLPESLLHRRLSASDRADTFGEDGDTCRICRGEGTPEEPLFYPCKCSGSIKFVHQDCLMEWLSHSQKKYCELCKTSFRFTKLYHPGMPATIPTSVFLRRALLHVVRYLVTLCRALLVSSVWLVALPYCMRLVWRSLFWVGDGAWARELYEPSASAEVTSASEATSAAVSNQHAAAMSRMPPGPVSNVLNMTVQDPSVMTFIKHLVLDLTPFGSLHHGSEGEATSAGARDDVVGLTMRRPSLLSNVTFLRWFSSEAANRFVLDIFEGIIITLCVVVAFILIFLIREWVVQQQPVINMAAFNQNPLLARVPDPAEDGLFPEEEHDAAHNDEVEPDIVEHAHDNNMDAETQQGRDVNGGEAEPPLFPQLPLTQNRLIDVTSNEEIPEDIRRAIRDELWEDVSRLVAEMPDEEWRRVLRLLPSTRSGSHAAERSSSISSDFEESGPSRARERTPVHPSTISTVSSASQQSSSMLPQPDIEEGETSDDLNQRPNMPVRERSSIATEIRRNWEEGESWSYTDVAAAAPHRPDSWNEADAGDQSVRQADDEVVSDREQNSEGSYESWQQIHHDEQDTEPEGLQHKIRSTSGEANEGHPHVNHTESHTRTQTAEAAEELHESPGSSTDSSRPDPAVDPVLAGSAQLGDSDQEEPEVQIPAPQPAPRPLWDRFLDWMFGDIPANVPRADEEIDDEHVVEDLAAEAPFVPFAGNEPREPAVPRDQDREVAAAAAQAGINLNDQDAIDDAEDLEGIMELIGMQGPLVGLFQNAMFSAVLISATLACAVWIPYLAGKVVLLLVGHPMSCLKIPLKIIATSTDIVVDLSILTFCGLVCWIGSVAAFTLKVFTLGMLSGFANAMSLFIAKSATSMMRSSVQRLGGLMFNTTLRPDHLRLSVNSHAALRNIQNSTGYALHQTGNTVITLLETVKSQSPPYTAFWLLRQLPSKSFELVNTILQRIISALSWLASTKLYKISLNLDLGHDSLATYPDGDIWTATDRLIAITAGYACFALVGGIYLSRGSLLSSSRQGRRIEGVVAEILQQAGGVLKVILIISIEMLVFPLYCGLLLDVALLPLFADAGLASRWQFARSNPWTSVFVHWFIGTCYMFHFALFVSMCRKIMRKGVLYFIRDPDDPTFHPVRDVLERSVTTQLRKIAFSAVVYGALVIVCLGGVVWCLDRGTTGVLPIQWSSQAPSVEFPLNLLVYNILTPFVIKIFKPSDGLQLLYEWWFKACARVLRLSHFLFGDQVKEEEGHHVRHTWYSWFIGEKGDPEHPVTEEDERRAADQAGRPYFVPDGKYVRAPASDQTRIPKGETVFVEVDENNNRKDGKTEGGVHNTDAVTMVYIPPWFRMRIAAFVMAMWVFAAATGVSFTIIPLLFGRYLFSFLLAPTAQRNDIHALALGVYTLGALGYGSYRLYKAVTTLNGPIPSPLTTMVDLAIRGINLGMRILRVVYVWTTLVLLIPLLIAALLELYFLTPLHAYMNAREPHVIPVIQDWTLGFLYARVIARLVFAGTTRAGRAFNSVVADGYLNPNARIATKCFLLPVFIVFGVAILAPATLAWTLNRTVWMGASDTTKQQVWRFSFPLLGLGLLGAWIGREGLFLLNRWRMVVRDEVYLIGERLHNFGDKRALQPQQQRVEENAAVDVVQ